LRTARLPRFRRSTDPSAPTKPRRWRRFFAIVAATSGVVALLAVVVQFGLPGSWGDRDHLRAFESDQGRQTYQVHLPPGYTDTEQLPVMMAIHGCVMTGFGYNSMKDATQFNTLADEDRFIVVYPTQTVFANKINCWNSIEPAHQLRGTGEPALLAGVAQQVIDEFNADPNQIHVSGASSGAGTAVILGATYPDIFASVTSVAGGEYALNQVNADAPQDLPPQSTGKQAWAQMGTHARPVPLLVVQGDADDVVPTLVADRLVEQWATVSDLATDGVLNGDVDDVADDVTEYSPAGLHAYTQTTYNDADGNPLIESYLVKGQAHAWSGPDGSGWFTDQAGPDLATLSWDFAQAHPMEDQE